MLTKTRKIIDFYNRSVEEARVLRPESSLSEEDVERAAREMLDIEGILAELSMSAEKHILERMKEGDAVDLINAAIGIVSFTMLSRNEDVGPLLLLLGGDSKGFCHTLVLSVIGALIDEEVL